MNWLYVLGPLGLILAGFAAVWYKNKAAAGSAQVDALTQQAKNDADKRQAQEAAAAAKDAADRTTLETKVAEINKLADEKTRLQLSLNVLAGLRKAK